MLSIMRETPDQEEVAALLDAADARSAALYPAESRHGLTRESLVRQGVRFFVARMAGRAVGCGGYLPGAGGCAEVKRIFVDAEARGLGIGRALMRHVEAQARAEGTVVLQLETGVQSVEALGLYRSLGYAERGPFGAYRPDPLSVFMEKPLA
jgi:putative acetyltransferase